MVDDANLLVYNPDTAIPPDFDVTFHIFGSFPSQATKLGTTKYQNSWGIY